MQAAERLPKRAERSLLTGAAPTRRLALGDGSLSGRPPWGPTAVWPPTAGPVLRSLWSDVKTESPQSSSEDVREDALVGRVRIRSDCPVYTRRVPPTQRRRLPRWQRTPTAPRPPWAHHPLSTHTKGPSRRLRRSLKGPGL